MMWMTFHSRLRELFPDNDSLTVDDIVSVDANVISTEERTDDQIVTSVLAESRCDSTCDSESDDELSPSMPVPTPSEALTHVEKMRIFLEAQSDIDKSVFKCLDIIERTVLYETPKTQKTILDFFKK